MSFLSLRNAAGPAATSTPRLAAALVLVTPLAFLSGGRTAPEASDFSLAPSADCGAWSGPVCRIEEVCVLSVSWYSFSELTTVWYCLEWRVASVSWLRTTGDTESAPGSEDNAQPEEESTTPSRDAA